MFVEDFGLMFIHWAVARGAFAGSYAFFSEKVEYFDGLFATI